MTYVVRAGDTLRQIARLFQVSVSQILSWNGMSSGAQILKGQKLTILETAKQRPPSDTAQYCDLAKNPNENKQFEVKI